MTVRKTVLGVTSRKRDFVTTILRTVQFTSISRGYTSYWRCLRRLQSPRKGYVREGHPEQRADTVWHRGRNERPR